MLRAGALNQTKTVLGRVGAGLIAATILTAVPMLGAQAGLQFRSSGAPAIYTAQLPHGSVSLAATDTVSQLGDGPGAPTLRMTASTTVTVTAAATLVSISITPPNPSIGIGGSRQQLTATGTYSNVV